jgi:predicted dehydrogenase
MSAVVAVVTPVRLGFVGLGWIGRRRLDSIAARNDFEIAALVDSDDERRASAACAYPQALATTQLDRMLDEGLDGVVIATPNVAHADQAIECLRRGVAVFCQKPLAIDAHQTSRVLDAAQSANRLLAVDLCYRYVSGMSELRDAIANGDLGRLLSIELTFHNAYGPDKRWCFDRRQSGGGCLLDLGIHLLDLAQWLRPSVPMRISDSRRWAQGRALGPEDSDVEDLAMVDLDSADGARVRLTCSWNAPIGCDAIIGARILGTARGAVWRNLKGSFYDFELQLCTGTSRSRLGGAPDDWGSRALGAWIERLQVDRSFDPRTFALLDSAALIDAAYER